MKSLSLAAAALLLAGAATAQTTEIPAMKCEPKPQRPGDRMMDATTVRRRFEREMKTYGECVKAYVAERQAAARLYEKAAKAEVEAGNSVVTEYNAFVKETYEAAGGK